MKNTVFNRQYVAKLPLFACLCILCVMCVSGCRRRTVPKEYGYFRIDLPEHSYRPVSDNSLPYSFLISDIAETRHIEHENEKYWIDITYPSHNAVVHCSYKRVRNNLRNLTDDAMEFVFSHAVKASAIPEQAYMNPQERVYGIVFDLEGNTATPMQFFLTDSVHHFFRGALYFNNIPNQDSLAPVTTFIREDMRVLIESFKWENRH